MSKAYIFINEHVQPYSYLKSNLNLGKKSSVKFDVLNSHVVNTVVLPGEIIIVGDDSVLICTAEEAFYMRKALEVHLAIMTNGMQGDGFLVENHELLTRILGYSSIGIGAVGGAWSKHLDGIKNTLENIEAAHGELPGSGGAGSRDAFYAKRKTLFEKLDAQLKSFARFGSGLRNQGSIKDMLGISTKSYLHTGTIAGYAETINGVAKASSLMKKGTYLGVGLSVTATGASIYNACTTGREDQCRKAKYVEGGKLSGGLFFGALGGAAGGYGAALACALVFGISTGGPGALACGVIGGGIGGLIGGESGESFGELSGELLYEHSLK
ncbi:hypothetical protein KVG88_13015 [Pseudomonas sp. SWRI74]|jgi:hypothetical protein|uniref:SSU ribosomal protein S2p (SAe) n=1 Tax=Pseudomonas azerbaijanoccidentalis TaxID=2842347 RepID=A0ABS6QPZ3_9PSED|nr:hypothetical protein [Pseudomonas azerbaijanoccidentalis]MBV4520988.1 hypothetical protein [Pseudomonas azerbaijanoccidentalis]